MIGTYIHWHHFIFGMVDTLIWHQILDDWSVVSNILYFPFHIWVVILPIDELIFFRGVGQPPTR